MGASGFSILIEQAVWQAACRVKPSVKILGRRLQPECHILPGGLREGRGLAQKRHQPSVLVAEFAAGNRVFKANLRKFSGSRVPGGGGPQGQTREREAERIDMTKIPPVGVQEPAGPVFSGRRKKEARISRSAGQWNAAGSGCNPSPAQPLRTGVLSNTWDAFR